MQPYFFPYLGYFRLLCASDKFIFYDDASFSKNGWYNRNRIFNPEKQWEYIRVALTKAPLNTACNEILLSNKERDHETIRKQLNRYRSAPYFRNVEAVVDAVFEGASNNLASIAIESVVRCASYLGIQCEICKSSEMCYSRSGDATSKVLEICQIAGASEYINLPGGHALYDPRDFAKAGVRLAFCSSDPVHYAAGSRSFVPNLSVLDALMWTHPDDLRQRIENNAR